MEVEYSPVNSPTSVMSTRSKLRARKPAPRGEAAKPALEAKHASAEHRFMVQRDARVGAAARHNAKAGSLPKRTRSARRRALQERKNAQNMEMAAAAERHAVVVNGVARKGRDEVVKVKLAVAALQYVEADVALQDAREQELTMQAALRRRAATLEAIAQRGHAESEKVEQAAARVQAETEAKAERLHEHEQAAAQRHAAKISETVSKASAESAKVDRVNPGWRDAHSPQRYHPHDGSGDEETGAAAPSAETPGTMDRASRRRKLRASPERPPPIVGTRAGEADLLLRLMRAGAPNLELLNARGLDDLTAIARAHGIALSADDAPAAIV